MVTIELLGDLAEIGPIPPLGVRSPAEAIRFITEQVPAFREHLEQAAATNGAYQVIVDGEDVDEQGLQYPVIETITIAPVIAGSGAFGRILLGAVLLGVSFIMPASLLGISSTLVGQFAASMIIGGVISLIAPPDNEQKNQNSYLLGAGQASRITQGQRVPIGFGDVVIENPLFISAYTINSDIPIDYQVP